MCTVFYSLVGRPCTYRCTIDTRSGFVSSVSSDFLEDTWDDVKEMSTTAISLGAISSKQRTQEVDCAPIVVPCTICNDLVLPSYRDMLHLLCPQTMGYSIDTCCAARGTSAWISWTISTGGRRLEHRCITDKLHLLGSPFHLLPLSQSQQSIED